MRSSGYVVRRDDLGFCGDRDELREACRNVFVMASLRRGAWMNYTLFVGVFSTRYALASWLAGSAESLALGVGCGWRASGRGQGANRFESLPTVASGQCSRALLGFRL